MGCGCGKSSGGVHTASVQPKQVVKKTPITPSKKIIRRVAK